MARTVQRLLIAILAAFLYILGLPEGTGSEVLVRRGWATPLSGAALVAERPAVPQEQSDADAIPVVLGRTFAYMSPTGEVRTRGAVAYGIAAGRGGFISYPRRPDSLVLQSPDGAFLASVAGSAYPAISSDVVLTIGTDQQTLHRYTWDGALEWDFRAPSLVTALDAREDLVVVGTVDGRVIGVGPDGSVRLRDRPAGSEIAVTYGVSVARGGSRVAVLCGLRPQTVLVYERVEGVYAPMFRRQMGSEFRRAALIEMLDGGELVAVESSDGLYLINPDAATVRAVPMGAPAVIVGRTSTDGLLVGLSHSSETPGPGRQAAELVIFGVDGSVIGRIRWSGDQADLQVQGRRVFAGWGATVFSLQMDEG